MALTMMISTAATNTKEEDAAAEIARPSQNLKKCKYCNYEHWDDFDLRFYEEMHKEYCEEKRRLMAKASRIRNDIQ